MIRYCFHLVIYEAVDFSKLGSDSIYYDPNIVHNITKYCCPVNLFHI